jgi:hypothetical protein
MVRKSVQAEQCVPKVPPPIMTRSVTSPPISATATFFNGSGAIDSSGSSYCAISPISCMSSRSFSLFRLVTYQRHIATASSMAATLDAIMTVVVDKPDELWVVELVLVHDAEPGGTLMKHGKQAPSED